MILLFFGVLYLVLAIIAGFINLDPIIFWAYLIIANIYIAAFLHLVETRKI